MFRIDIYIEIKYEGNFANGKGTYAIALEMLDKENNPHTREHFGGYIETTNNRVWILAIIEALKHVNKPCEIEIHVNSAYIAKTINEDRLDTWRNAGWKSNGKDIKNADLWEKYLFYSARHLVRITDEKENSYTRVLIFTMNTRKINYITDYRGENEQ